MSTQPILIPPTPIPSLVQPKNSLLKSRGISQLRAMIIEEVHKIPDWPGLKLDLELLTMVCCLAEDLCVAALGKIDKKQLVTDIYRALFPQLSVLEITSMQNNIQYLFDHHRIKPTSLAQWIYSKSAQCLHAII